MNTKILRGPDKIYVVLDKAQVFPHDPGQGTPAMVYIKGKENKANSTYGCASHVGSLEGFKDGDSIELNNKQMDWLYSIEDEIGDFLKW